MAQSGYTPILIYGSGTASNIPSAANLTSSANGAELALNYADGKLYYKSSAGTVTLLADQNAVTVATANGFGGTIAKATATTTPAITIRTSVTGVLVGNGTAVAAAVSGTDFKTINSTSILGSGNISITSTPGGSTTQVQYNNAGAFAGSANFVFDGTNVGIGTTSPNTAGYGGSVLGIYGASSTGGNLWLTSDATVAGNRAGRIGFGTEGNSSNKEIARVWSITAGSTAGNLGGDLLFNTKADGGSLTERMRITAAGDVGIGTSSPGSKLTVSGDIQILSTNYLSFSNTAQQTYIRAAATSTLAFGTNSTEVMRLDSSGNLGLGVTPSGWDTTNSVRALQLTQGAVWGYSAANMYLAANNYWNGTNRIYLSNNTAGEYRITGNVHAWMQAPSGTAGNAITFTQAMTLDASGNLGVGVTSPSFTAGSGIHVYRTSGAAVRVQDASTDFDVLAFNGNATLTNRSNGAMIFATNNTERARIDSSGNLGIGLTPVANNGILQLNSYGAIKALIEGATVSATAATGTINYDAATQAVVYYTSNASANWTVNFRGSGSLSLNSMMQTGQSLTVAFLVTQGSTAYYNSAVQVDGSSVTPKWQGGTAPSAGNASSIDSYVYTIIKTGAATFTVLASQTKFA